MVVRAYDRARTEAKAVEAAVMRGDVLGALRLPVAIKGIQAMQGILRPMARRSSKTTFPWPTTTSRRLSASPEALLSKDEHSGIEHRCQHGESSLRRDRKPDRRNTNVWGSSGGAAVAVATNMVPFATGSDH
jgi:Asp-tRNA(Asn)/Glu-tRNA(Gln) amidotransferase A subunit family amidase